MIQFNNCEKCINGYLFTEGEARKCQCRINWEKQIKIQDKLQKANLSLDTKGHTLDNYKGADRNSNIKKLTKFVNNFTKAPFCNLHQYWYGEQGTQKSFTAKTICLEIIKQHVGASARLPA